jgi:maltooligosyltrehalose trehalohydrolase
VIAAGAWRLLDGAVLSQAFLPRWFRDPATSGCWWPTSATIRARVRAGAPSPARDARWQMAWSSDEPRYGGPGALEPCGGGWRLAAESATLLAPAQRP